MKQIKPALFLLTLLSIGLNYALAQGADNLSSFVPAVSQNLGETGGMKNITTDYYTGRLSYQTPLTNVNIYGIGFPVSLNYSTSGIKVQEVSGVTGLGWTSSLGGEITRDVQGIPDEFAYGYFGAFRTGGKNYSAFNLNDVKKVNDGSWDSEPDKFYFSFLGFSGSFVMDPDGKPVLQSNQSGLKIEYCPFKRGQTSGYSMWILRDQAGNQYYFEATQTMNSLMHQATKNVNQIYTSAWYITKIITAANQQVDFSYEDGSSLSYTNYLNIRRIDYLQNGNPTKFTCLGNKHTGDTTYNQNVDINYQPRYLKKIAGNGISINLGYNLLRTDLANGKALTDISVVYNNRAVNTYKLNYGYFTSTDGTNTKRLKLSNVVQVYPGNILKTIFSYFYNETVNLPARNSLKTDYLGYYNNNTQSSNIKGFGDKTPNLVNAQANVLQKVSDIFGGSVNVEYELNNYYSVAASSNLTAAGLRVAKVYEKRYDADNIFTNQYTVSYTVPGSTQSSGQLYTMFLSYQSYSYYVNCGSGQSGYVAYNSSEPLESLTDERGVYIGYSKVTVNKGDASSLRYTFTNFSDYPDKHSAFGISTTNNSAQFNNAGQVTLEYYPGGPTTSFAFARGKMLSEELIDAGGQTVKITTNLYSLTSPLDLVVGLRFQLYSTEYSSYNIYGFTYSTQDLRLDSKTTQFKKSGNVQQTTTDSYTYTTYAPNLIKDIITSGSSGRSDKITFRYPFDVIPAVPLTSPTTSAPLTFMVNNNNIGNPVEVIHSVIRNGQSKIITTNVTKFAANNNGVIAPFKEFKSEFSYPLPDNEYVLYKVAYNGNSETETFDSRLKPFRYYSKYNLNVNLTEEQTSTVPAKLHSYIYGYNNNHQIAAIENAKLDDVAYTSFESSESGNWVLNASPVFDLSSVTGTRLYDLSKGSITKSSLMASTSYYVTYWTKNANSYAISGTQGTPTLLAGRNGWNCYQHLLTGISTLTLSGNGYIDELRLYPVGAKMTTATYEPLIGMTSKNDDNNQITYYNYDEFNRLQYIRDNGRNIIQAYCYNFNGEAGNCFTTVSNQAQSGSFNRNNCGKGIRGASVTYTVPAGRYVASTQQAANGLAQIEIDQNGQNYANSNGTCSSLTLYARIEYSNYTGDSWSDPNTGEQASSSLADVTIKLYSDAAGSVPFVLDRTITVIVTEGSTQTTAYNGTVTGSSNTNYTISAGQSSLSLGHRLLSSYGQYLDPYSGSGFIYESSDYTYNVVDNNDEYVSL